MASLYASAMPSRTSILSLPVELWLEISSYLDMRAHARLARIRHGWRGLFTQLLFLSDAKYYNSSAIKWAALLNPDDPIELFTSLRILRLSLKCNGNVNAKYEDGGSSARAIHFAAARCNTTFLKILLEKGANVQATCTGLYKVRRLRMHIKTLVAWMGSSDIETLPVCEWLPHLVPLLKGHEDTVDILKRAGSPNHVTLYEGRIHLTLLHLAALPNLGWLAQQISSEQLLTYRNFQSHPRGLTPLHLAVEHLNETGFNKLIRAGADVNLRTAAARSPLTSAIKYCYRRDTPCKRKINLKFIRTLIDRGADVNAESNHVLGETPLLEAIASASRNWKHTHIHMKDIIDLLIERGTQINLRSSHGVTAVHKLIREIYRRGGNKSLEDLLVKLIKKGADVNMPFSNNSSILGDVILNRTFHPLSLLRLLLNHEATLLSHEVDGVFQLWCQFKLLRKYLSMQSYKRLISRRALMRAYAYCVETSDLDLYTTLLEEFKEPSDPNQLIRLRLTLRRSKLDLEWLMDCSSFDPNWSNPESGDGYIHQIVQELDDDSTYRENQAMDDTWLFIKRGTSLQLKDNGDKTALQRLRMSNASCYANLRLLFYEAMELQAGTMEKDMIYSQPSKKRTGA